MLIIRLEKDVYDVFAAKGLSLNTDYVIPRELLIRFFATASDGFLSVRAYTISKPFDPDKDWNGKRIVVHRSGSAGDLLFITPLLREIKRRWPQCHITIDCERHYAWIFDRNPHIDAVISPPLTLGAIEAFDAQIDLESASEFHPQCQTLVLTDVYAAAAGISLPGNKTLYTPAPEIVERMAQRYPKPTRWRVGMSLRSDNLLRDYPYQQSIEVVGALMQVGIQVMLLGKTGTGIKSTKLFFDSANEKPALTWEESVALMKTCDLVLGPDSSAVHFAGAMGIPSLGLFGPFPAALRIPPQPATQALEGKGPCAPCFHHGRGGIPCPPHGPCMTSGQCDVLASIPSQKVVEKILAMLGINKGQAVG